MQLVNGLHSNIIRDDIYGGLFQRAGDPEQGTETESTRNQPATQGIEYTALFHGIDVSQRQIRQQRSEQNDHEIHKSDFPVTAFGEDENGELYLTVFREESGAVYAIRTAGK